jgi:hypothetical protein
MTEMRTLAMGQYGHNNQPSHHILFLFAQLGDTPSTEQYVREVLTRGYGIDFYAGDEDNGEMGAWFVLSALGLFSTTPGTPDYVLTSPLFRHTVVHRSDEAHFIDTTKGIARGERSEGEEEDDFHIIAMNAAPLNVHTTKILFNGQLHSSPTLSDEVVRGGKVLQFFLETAETSAEMERAGEREAVEDKEVTLKAAREAQRRHAQPRSSEAATGGVGVEEKEGFQKEIEKQKKLIASLTNELAGLSHFPHLPLTFLAPLPLVGLCRPSPGAPCGP